jgi:hypothetical protein
MLCRLLSRLLAVLLLAGACVLVGPAGSGSAAAPCTCTAAGAGNPTRSSTGSSTGTVEDHVKDAGAVFTGTVEAITPPGGTAGNGFSRTSTVRVERVYKGEMITTESVEVVTTRAFGNCTRELVQDETYVFFVESDEGFTATACGGTTIANSQLITHVERLLGAGREPVAPEPPTATFSPVSADDPASLTRVAAPGLALVLIGLLGLAVVRRLARPRP